MMDVTTDLELAVSDEEGEGEEEMHEFTINQTKRTILCRLIDSLS